MKPIDTVNPILPGNPLRKAEDRRRQDRQKRQSPEEPREQRKDRGQGDHLIDELA